MSSDFSALLASSSQVLSSAQKQSQSQKIGTVGTAHGNIGLGKTSSFGNISGAAPALKRSLRELSIASAHLGLGSNASTGTLLEFEKNQTQSNPNREANAQRLLAREGGGFDAARLGRSARQLELLSSSTPSKNQSQHRIDSSSLTLARTPYGVRSGLLRAGEDGGIPIDGTPGTGGDVIGGRRDGLIGMEKGEDLEMYLKRRHDQMLSSILTTQRQATYKAAEDLIQKRMEKELDKDTDLILRDLTGYRLHQPTPIEEIDMNVSTQTKNFHENSIHTNTAPENTQPIYSTSIEAAYGAGSKLSDSSRRHASIVATINQNDRTESYSSTNQQNYIIDNLLKDIQGLAFQLNSSSITASNTAYLNSIKLIKSIVQHDQFTRSNNCTKNRIVQYRGEGILAFLCQQFRAHIVDCVRSAALAGHTFQSRTTSNTNSSGFANDVASYVELEMGLGLNSSALKSSLLWPKLYFCLRCGDANAALETLQDTKTNELEQPILLSMITSLSKYQSIHGGLSLWDVSEKNTNPSIPTSISSTLQKNLSDTYHRASARSTSSSSSNFTSMDNYKVAVLALLSLVDMPNSILSIKGIVNTIEDYIFCYLWDAVQSQEPESKLPLTYGPSTIGTPNAPDIVTSSTCMEKISKLGEMIKHWGAEHFQVENDVGGWSYSMPLLASQQFQSAIVHLADMGSQQKNGLVHAAHLAIILDCASINMEDLNLGKKQNGDQESLQLLTSLLVAYSSSFQSIDPEAALEYLVRLPSIGKEGRLERNVMKIDDAARKNIIRLINETRAYELLAGSVSPDGHRIATKFSEQEPLSKRGGGALDAHFSPAEVSSLLAGAAEEAMQDGNMRDAAELLALAERFSALFMLMNRELGSHLVVESNQEKEERKFWKNVTLQFYNVYLSKGRTHVQEVLEADDNLSLIRTFNLLMNLIEFFDRCADQKWEDAWSVVIELRLIPITETDISFHIESFNSMDDSIKKSFHHIILASMESLYHIFVKLKSSPGPNVASAEAIDQRLQEMKNYGRILVTFAGLIQMYDSGNIHSRIAQMEAYML